MTESIASGPAALRLPHVFVSSSCEAPGPAQGLQRLLQQLEPDRALYGRPGPHRRWVEAPEDASGATHHPPASRAPAAGHQHRTAAGEPARPAHRSGVGSQAGSRVRITAAAVLAEPTPLGIRTQRLLPAPRGWSCHPSPGLAQGKVRPPVAFRKALYRPSVAVPRPFLQEPVEENYHTTSETRPNPLLP